MIAIPAVRSDGERARRAAQALARLRPGLAEEVHRCLGATEAVGLLAQLADLHTPLAALFPDADALAGELVRLALRAAVQRPAELRAVDRRREIDPQWFQHPRMIGYVAYTERFAGTLDALPDRLDHLAELGVTYLHLMPLLEPRDGANDGGYAVADYRAVDPRLGTMDDLSLLAGALRARGMSLCIDLVLNHTAREHPWARGRLAGDPANDGFYLAFPDRTMPTRPPSWTSSPTTNPRVFAALLDTILWLASRGVEIFRMDAVPFMGKRLGTSCMNQPEVHDIVQVLHACTRLAAPATVFEPGDQGRAAGRPVAAPAAPDPGRDVLGHLRALPRRHRLGRGRGRRPRRRRRPDRPPRLPS